MRKISFCEIWGFGSLFSRAPIRTFSSELFQTTYYIYDPEKCEKECNMLEHTGTGFLSAENESYSIS